MLFKDANANSPPKRLDLSGLKPEVSHFNAQQEVSSGDDNMPTLKIRSGSLGEKLEMDKLLGANAQSKMTAYDSPAVLVIRSKKHSLDENEVNE